jgi:hypothetical protein
MLGVYKHKHARVDWYKLKNNNRYVTYHRVTLRNCHVRENKSLYRVYNLVRNSVIAGLLRSNGRRRSLCSTQSPESRVHEGLRDISCCV